MMKSFLIIIVFVALSLVGRAEAHEIRPGYLQIEEQVNSLSETPGIIYRLVWKAPIRLGAPLAVTPELPTDCLLSGITDRKNTGFAIISRLDFICTEPIRGKLITFKGLDATLTDVLVRYQPASGKQQTLRATANVPFVEISVKPSRWDVARTYFILGVEHIWFGFDHLLFVLGLVLLISGARRIVETITAFTLAHSITLIATTFGWISLPIAPVEAVIALSIIFLATEILAKKPDKVQLSEKFPWIIASAFGLLHGFGFASALSNIGMPEQDVPTALLTFNLGVEFGQLSFVVVLFIALYLAKKIGRRRFIEITASYFIGSLSMFWLIERVI